MENTEEWISVKDKLPEPGMYLCKTGDTEFPAIYSTTLNGNRKFIAALGNMEAEYWKDLPNTKKNK